MGNVITSSKNFDDPPPRDHVMSRNCKSGHRPVHSETHGEDQKPARSVPCPSRVTN